jgi:hypothetical protein
MQDASARVSAKAQAWLIHGLYHLKTVIIYERRLDEI